MPTDPARTRQTMNPEELEAAFQAVPSEMIAEILDGELFVSPRPAAPHANVTGNLFAELDGPFRKGRGGPGGWIILFEPEIHLGPRPGHAKPDKVVPDLAGWRRTRMEMVPDEPAITLVPDWVCEVLSPRNTVNDRVRKQRIYAREGIGHVWHLDPIAQTLEIFRLEHGQWLLLDVAEGSEKLRAEPFDAIELELTALWAR